MTRLTEEVQNQQPRSSPNSIAAMSMLLGILFGLVTLVIWVWCVGAIWFVEDRLSLPLQIALTLTVAIGFPAWLVFCLRRQITAVWVIVPPVLVWLLIVGFYATIQPTHERDWGPSQRVLPVATIRGDEILIEGIRAFRYRNDQVIPNFYDDIYHLDQLRAVWFGVDRFTSFEPMAHTFLSFEFEPGPQRSNFLAFSVETRRESDESTYSPLKGLYRNYEMIYVIADERDVLSLRSDIRDHVVQLYPVKANKAQLHELLLDMLNRVNGLKEYPEFYHTLTNNCTNNIVFHTNQVLETPISPWQRGVIFPGYSDWLAFRRGMIDSELSLEQAREYYRVDRRAKQFDGTYDFSTFIRQFE